MRSKNTITLVVRLTPEHLQKINSTGLKNRSEVIRRCIDKTITERTKTSQNS
jgi:metal-responsive CopG/Arc/MetJ family transcriptional regulator